MDARAEVFIRLLGVSPVILKRLAQGGVGGAQVGVAAGIAHSDAIRPDNRRWLLGQFDDHAPHMADDLIASSLQQAARWLIGGSDPLLEDDAIIGRESSHRFAGALLDPREQRGADASPTRIGVDSGERLKVGALDGLQMGESQRLLSVGCDRQPGILVPVEVGALPDDADAIEHGGIGATHLLGFAGGDERHNRIAVIGRTWADGESGEVSAMHISLYHG